MTESDAITIRVVFVGDSQVGKTTIIHRYIQNRYDQATKSTIGAIFHTVEKVVNGQEISMQIWDTAGQEEYRSIGPIYYRNSAVVVGVFDLTCAQSLQDLDGWLEEVRLHTQNPLVVLAGNKKDLTDSIEITGDEIENFADSHNAKWSTVSAKTGDGIEHLFEQVLDPSIIHHTIEPQFGARRSIQNEVEEQSTLNNCRC